MDIIGKIKDLANQHPDQTKSFIEKGEKFIAEKTDHKFDDKIEQGGDAAERFLGTDKNNQ